MRDKASLDNNMRNLRKNKGLIAITPSSDPNNETFTSFNDATEMTYLEELLLWNGFYTSDSSKYIDYSQMGVEYDFSTQPPTLNPDAWNFGIDSGGDSNLSWFGSDYFKYATFQIANTAPIGAGEIGFKFTTPSDRNFSNKKKCSESKFDTIIYKPCNISKL